MTDAEYKAYCQQKRDKYRAKNPERYKALMKKHNAKLKAERDAARDRYLDTVCVEHTHTEANTKKYRHIYAVHDYRGNYLGEGNIFDIADALLVESDSVYSMVNRYGSYKNGTKKFTFEYVRDERKSK